VEQSLVVSETRELSHVLRGSFFQVVDSSELWWIELVFGDRISSVKFWLGNLLEGRWIEVLKWGVEQSLVVSETRELSHVEGVSFRS
jgi:hypothetical protein